MCFKRQILQTKGLIERSRTNERSKYPILTPKGVESLTKAIQAVERADEVFFSSINLEESRLLKTFKILARSES